MEQQLWQERIDDDVDVYWCSPADPAVRGPQEFPLTGFDQAMPKVHARMSMYYKLDEEASRNAESRRKIVSTMKDGLEQLASQLPCLTATVTLDPETKRGRLQTTGQNDAILFLARGVGREGEGEGGCLDLPTWQELEDQRFGPWMLTKGNTYPARLINPVSSINGHQGGLPGCIFQINFVRGGGAILTAAFHHYVADGPSVDHIFRAWCGYCRGEGRTVDMFTDRTRLIPSLSSPSSSSSPSPEKQQPPVEELERRIASRGCMVESTKPDHQNPWSNMLGSKMKTAIITFPKDKIAGFKDVVAAKRDGARVSTHDVLHALLWTGVVRAKRALLLSSSSSPSVDDKDLEEESSYTLYPISFRTSSSSSTTTTIPKNYIGNGTLLNGSSIPLSSLLLPSSSSEDQEETLLINAALSLRKTITQVSSPSPDPEAYVTDAVAWLSTIRNPVTRTWMTSPPRSDLDAGLTSWACMDYHSWDFGFGGGGARAMRPPASPIPFLFPLGGFREKEERGGMEVLEAAVAAEEGVHEWLMRGDGDGGFFGGWVREYWVEP